MIKTTAKVRRKIVKLVLQALYQWEVNRDNIKNIEKQFISEHKKSTVDWALFHKFLIDITSSVDELDNSIKELLDRDIKELDPVELSLLRLGSYSLHTCIEIPYEVIINESIELARMFGANDSYKFINAILDRLVDCIPARSIEKQNKPPKK